MKKMLLMFLLVISVTSMIHAGSFGSGNIVVFRAGDGVAALTNTGALVYLDEYTTAGALVQSIPMGSNFVCSGNSTTEGFLTLSNLGHYLVLGGYKATVGTTVTTSNSSTINRIIARVDQTGTVDQTTTLTDNITPGNPRSAAYQETGNNMWLTSSSGGIRTIVFGTTGTSTSITASGTNFRATNIFNSQLYLSTAAGGIYGVYAVGTGMPITSGQALTPVNGSTTSGPSPYGFNINSAGTAMYVADAVSTTGIQRWDLVGGVWTKSYTLQSSPASTFYGILVDWSTTQPTLYATAGAAIYKVVDAGAGSVLTSLVTAGTNTAFRSLAFAPSPLAGGILTITGTLNPFSQTSASPTAEQTYNIGGSSLVASVTLVPPAGFEISKTTGSGFVNSSGSLVYTAAEVMAGKTIYVRMNAGTLGGYSGNITHSSSDFATVNKSVSGTYTKIFYSKSSGNLDVLGTWGDVSDGSGTTPGAFATTGGQIYVVQNRASATVGAAWTIANISTGSKVVVGDGVNACNVTIPSGSPVTGTIDVSAGSTLTWGDAATPSLGTLNATSTVNYSQAGSFTVPASPLSYGNLTLTNGTKLFSPVTYSITGNLSMNGATNCNGGASPFTTINLAGNFTMSGGATFDTANGNRLTLVLDGSGLQTLDGGGNEIIVFRLTVANSAGAVLTDGTSNLTVCNLSGGGIALTTGNLNVNNNKVTFYQGKGLIGAGTGTFTCGANAEFTFSNVPSCTVGVGSLALTAGSQIIKNLTINLNAVSSLANYLTLGSPVTVTNGLFLTNGILKDSLANVLTLGAAASVTGGSATSFVNGPLSRTVASTSPASLVFPVGRWTSGAYRPVTLNVTQSAATSTVYTAEQIEGSHAALTLGSIASVSAVRYVTLSKGAGATVTAASLIMNYGTDDGVGANNAKLRIAQGVGGAWVNLGGSGSAPTTGTITSAVNFTTFGDFILGQAAATLSLTAFLEGYTNIAGTAMNHAPSAVTVELHNSSAPYALVESRTGSLSTSGVGAFDFGTAVNGTGYYIAVKTWNTVETWSASAQSFSSGALSYDFTTASTQAYLSNMTQIGGAKWCIFSGDVNQDSYVNLGDYNLVNNDSYNQVTGVVATDLTGDQFTNLADYNIVNNNSYNQVKVHTPLVNPTASITKPMVTKPIRRTINNN